MGGLLLLLAALAAVLYGSVRVFRRRVQARLDSLELPPELAAAKAAALARTASRPAMGPRAGAAPASASPAGALVPPPSAAAPAPHFVLTYEVGPDFLQRRAQFRDEHLKLAWKAADAGELVLAGALEEAAGQAMLLFRGTREAALRFAAADPYVRHGLVRKFSVRQWHTTVGPGASAPLRPAG